TSFIVGFPGKSDVDFTEVVTFLKNVEFDNVGVFLYSDEEGTGAFDLDGKVSRSTATRRRDRLMKAQAQISTRRLSAMVGKQVEVLLEGESEESELLLQGRMETQAPEIDGRVLINDIGDKKVTPGEFYRVEITESHEYDLVGRLL